jgi:thiol-disulfide isomerase/thioredoxin
MSETDHGQPAAGSSPPDAPSAPTHHVAGAGHGSYAGHSLIDFLMVLGMLGAVSFAGITYKQSRDALARTQNEAQIGIPVYELAGVALPAIEILRDGGVQRFQLADAKSPALVVFFRSTCPACEATAPDWKKLRARLAPGTRFIVVSTEGDSVVHTWLERHDLHADEVVYPAPSSGLAAWGVKAVPTTLITDVHGVVKYARVGTLTSASVTAIGETLGTIGGSK